MTDFLLAFPKDSFSCGVFKCTLQKEFAVADSFKDLGLMGIVLKFKLIRSSWLWSSELASLSVCLASLYGLCIEHVNIVWMLSLSPEQTGITEHQVTVPV